MWFPKWIRCPKCGKRCEFKGISNDLPEYYCKAHGVIRWIQGKKFLKLPLPFIARSGSYYARFDKEQLPPFWRSALGVYQDENGDIWYQRDYRVEFNRKTLLFRLYVDGKPIMVKKASVHYA